jgi:CelD/BcsL family acetyltransferase involved in cellulose biosynthesis
VSSTVPPTSDAATALVVERPEQLEPHLDAWDALAAAAGRPFCTPAWMLAWWREGRSGDARLRVVLVRDADDTLVGVGPFFAQVAFGLAEYRLLGAGFSHRVGPLAVAGREREAAAAIAAALALATPAPASVVFEGIEASDPWPELFADGWPGRRPRVRTDVEMDSPAIALDADFEAWMARRERKFRKEARRVARRLEEEGVTRRLATDEPAVEALLRLHYARWEERGGSNVGEEARRVIGGALRAFDDDARMAVALLEGPDGPVAADLVLRAGDAIGFWGGGFDPAWSKHAPGTQTMLLALEAAAASGARSADLGGGAHDYKWRLSDENRPLAWRTLFPLGRRYPLIRLRLAPKHLRYGARRLTRRLPAERQQQLRRLLRRDV